MGRLTWALLAVTASAFAVAGASFATHNYSGNADSVVTLSDAGPGGNAFLPGNDARGPEDRSGCQLRGAKISEGVHVAAAAALHGHQGSTDWPRLRGATSPGAVAFPGYHRPGRDVPPGRAGSAVLNEAQVGAEREAEEGSSPLSPWSISPSHRKRPLRLRGTAGARRDAASQSPSSSRFRSPRSAPPPQSPTGRRTCRRNSRRPAHPSCPI